MTALILGAAGQMGAALAAILGQAGVRRLGADRVAAPEAMFEAQFVGDATAPDAALRQAAVEADVIVLATPLEPAAAMLSWIAGAARPGALVVETFSVKAPAAALAARLPDHLEVLGINPLFAPSLDWSGRPLLAAPYRGGPATERFLGWIAGAGVQIAKVGPEEHDSLLARRQGAAHAALLALGAVLADEKTDVPLGFGPPPYQTLLMALARIVYGDAHVYAEIQALNPDAAGVRAELAAALQALDGDLDATRAQVEALQVLKPGLAEANDACARLFQRPILEAADRPEG